MKNKIFFGLYIFLIICLFLNFGHAKASYYINASDTLSRNKINELSSHTIKLKLSNNERIATGYNLKIDFGEDESKFSVDGAGTTIADFDFNDGVERNIVGVDGSCAGHAGSSDLAIGIDDTTGIITFTPCASFTQSSINASITIKYGASAIVGGTGTNRVLNPALTGMHYINIHKGTEVGTNIAIAIISTDEMAITGTVEPMIVFTLGTNQSLSFGQFLTTKARFATDDGLGSETEPIGGKPISIYAGSNGQGGVTVYMYDDGDGTNSGMWAVAPVSEIIPAAPANEVIDGSKKYAVYAKNSSGLNINPNFDNNDLNGELAISRAPSVIASNNLPLSGGSFDLVLKAATDGTTKAGHYSDKITVLCTAIY